MIVSRFIKKMKESKEISLPARKYTEENDFRRCNEAISCNDKDSHTFQAKPMLTAWPQKAISVCLKNLCRLKRRDGS